jgi:hypothetical protein
MTCARAHGVTDALAALIGLADLGCESAADVLHPPPSSTQTVADHGNESRS